MGILHGSSVSNQDTANILHTRPIASARTIEIFNVPAISFEMLKSVTNNFNEENILGNGGFGTVYKDELDNGKSIVVKQMAYGVMTQTGWAEFKNEIKVVNKIRHKHLVALLGCCIDDNERIFVYEYMSKDTLSKYMFHYKREGLKPIEWNKRLTVTLDIARSVEHLHSLGQQSFVYHDLKPSNIFLGDDIRAKVGDFGLIQIVSDRESSA